MQLTTQSSVARQVVVKIASQCNHTPSQFVSRRKTALRIADKVDQPFTVCGVAGYVTACNMLSAIASCRIAQVAPLSVNQIAWK